jgi:hypothetical protein
MTFLIPSIIDMFFSDAVECSKEEYNYYLDERCNIRDIFPNHLYVAMFCSQGMRNVIKCGVKVHNIRQDEKELSRYIVIAEWANLPKPLPVVIKSDGITNGWLHGGGKLRITDTRAVEQGFLRQTGLDNELCSHFLSNEVEKDHSDNIKATYV